LVGLCVPLQVLSADAGRANARSRQVSLFCGDIAPINQMEDRAVANVVGGAVVFTVSAVLPLLVARAALALLITLMGMGRERGTEPQS
jgi:hypothetical protein